MARPQSRLNVVSPHIFFSANTPQHTSMSSEINVNRETPPPSGAVVPSPTNSAQDDVSGENGSATNGTIATKKRGRPPGAKNKTATNGEEGTNGTGNAGTERKSVDWGANGGENLGKVAKILLDFPTPATRHQASKLVFASCPVSENAFDLRATLVRKLASEVYELHLKLGTSSRTSTEYQMFTESESLIKAQIDKKFSENKVTAESVKNIFLRLGKVIVDARYASNANKEDKSEKATSKAAADVDVLAHMRSASRGKKRAARTKALKEKYGTRKKKRAREDDGDSEDDDDDDDDAPDVEEDGEDSASGTESESSSGDSESDYKDDDDDDASPDRPRKSRKSGSGRRRPLSGGLGLPSSLSLIGALEEKFNAIESSIATIQEERREDRREMSKMFGKMMKKLDKVARGSEED